MGRTPWILSSNGFLGETIDDGALKYDDLGARIPYSAGQFPSSWAAASPRAADISLPFPSHGQPQPFFDVDFFVGGGSSVGSAPQASRMQWSPSLAPADVVNALTPSIGSAGGAFQNAPLRTSETLQNNDPIPGEGPASPSGFLSTQPTPPQTFTAVGYRLPRPQPGMAGPWPIPAGPFETWGEHFIKSTREGVRRLRSFTRTARERAEKECWRRHDEEMRECNERYPDRHHNDHYKGCLERALQRRGACLDNGYPNGPGELPKWGARDEDVWFNTDR